MLLLGNSLTANAPKTGNVKIYDDRLYVHQEKTIQQAILSENNLIRCLIKYESGGDPNAVGDNGKARNVLQFWESTFDLYCEKYGANLDYNSAEDQIYLAYLMLKNNPQNVYHWTTAKYCL